MSGGVAWHTLSGQGRAGCRKVHGARVDVTLVTLLWGRPRGRVLPGARTSVCSRTPVCLASDGHG